MEVFIPILTTIIGAIIGAFSTFLITKYKLKIDEKRQKDENDKKAIENKADFEISEFWDFEQITQLSNKSSDLEIFVASIKDIETNGRFCAIYDKDNLDRSNWVTQKFEFKNTGFTEIMHLYLISNIKKTTCLFNIKELDMCISNMLLSYSAILEKRIKPNETFTLNISYHKDRIIGGLFSAAFSIGFCDKNNKYWECPLFAPDKKLYPSYPIPFKEFRDDIDFQLAMDCFREPYLW